MVLDALAIYLPPAPHVAMSRRIRHNVSVPVLFLPMAFVRHFVIE